MHLIRLWTVRYNFRIKNMCNFQNHGYKSFSTNFFIPRQSNLLINGTVYSRKCLNLYTKNVTRVFSSEQLIEPKDPDIFGDISGNNYQKLELDEDEKEQEEFEMNESAVPRYKKLSPGQYANIIKQRIVKGDIDGAHQVLYEIKLNRDKPTTHMYNLLIRAYAVQGQMKRALKLYNRMKKQNIKMNAATYTNVLNACANGHHHKSSLEHLEKIRDEIQRQGIPLNDIHYNAMVKAYGMHHRLLDAFQMVDLMIDNKMPIDEDTFNALMIASISDKTGGLRHTLNAWHLMLRWRIKPTLTTYNLLLRAIRDTKLGYLKANDKIIASNDETQIVIDDSKVPDLLARPPVITTLLINSVMPNNGNIKKTSTTLYNSPGPNELIRTDGENSNELIKSAVEQSNQLEIVEQEKPNADVNLQTIHDENRLILFGGYTGIIERMTADDVTPDKRTITLLMEIVPNSLVIENGLIKMANKKKIQLDIDFFNMLIKKRCLRKDFKNAKDVIQEIQRQGLEPNIMTWGVLALTCRTHVDAKALYEGMYATGHHLNAVIAGALIVNASMTNNFTYVNDVIDKFLRFYIKPSPELYDILDRFQRRITDIVSGKVHSKHTKNPRYHAQLQKFNRRYAKLQEKYDRDIRTAHIKIDR